MRPILNFAKELKIIFGLAQDFVIEDIAIHFTDFITSRAAPPSLSLSHYKIILRSPVSVSHSNTCCRTVEKVLKAWSGLSLYNCNISSN